MKKTVKKILVMLVVSMILLGEGFLGITNKVQCIDPPQIEY